jgi:recA bacterial DNA recombination protein
MASVATLRVRLESSLPERLSSTLLLRERAAPLTVSTGVAALDALTGGLPRGALSEIAGPASSGRTGVMLAALAGATRRQEVCALVDANDSFDPASAMAAGVDLERLLWVRCSDMPRHKFGATRTGLGHQKSASPANAGFAFSGVIEQVLKVTDLLLQGGGFGMVVLDLGDIPPESARRVPLTSWFRFRRAVEPTATVLLLVEQEPCAKTCASLVVQLEREAVGARDSAPVFTSLCDNSRYESGVAGESRTCPKSSPIGAAQVLLQTLTPWRVVAHGGLGVPENNAVSHASLLRGIRLRAEVVRSWTQRKPAQYADNNFELQAAW